jgi:hypothetical protein
MVGQAVPPANPLREGLDRMVSVPALSKESEIEGAIDFDPWYICI